MTQRSCSTARTGRRWSIIWPLAAVPRCAPRSKNSSINFRRACRGGSHPPPKEYSEAEFDIEREVFNDVTPCTPMELVSLIRKQPKEEGKGVCI
jgi:hypothetical protein